MDQRNKIESPEVDPHKCAQLLFVKDAKAIGEWRERQPFQQMVLDQLDINKQKEKSLTLKIGEPNLCPGSDIILYFYKILTLEKTG